MKNAYRQLGLLGIASFVALLGGALVQHYSSLPGRYTWLEPIRTLRVVFDHEWTPATFLLVYVLGVMRIARDEPRAAFEIGPAPWRMAATALVLGVVDALLFPRHNGFDVAAVILIGLTVARRIPPRRERALLVGHGVFAAVAFGCICYEFSVVKALTLVGREQADPSFVAIEQAMFGVVLHKAIAAWAATRPALVMLCDWAYFRLFHHMALTTVLLFGMRQRKERFEFLGALGFCYLLGGPLYHLFPGVGPSYFDQEAFGFLAELPLMTNEIRVWLFRNTMGILNGDAAIVRTWGYVACMPSLHIAHELVMLYYARRSTIALAISSVFTAITLVAVVVLGWHYAIDTVGGLLLAAVSIAIARWQRDRMMPAALAPLDDEPLPPRRPLRAWIAELLPALELPAFPAVARRVFAWVAVAGLFLRLGIALADPDRADRLFVPDNAYYTLSVARGLAHGQGLSTGGFSPLVMWLEAPIFAITGSEIVPVLWVWALSAIADAICIWLLGRLASRLGGPLAGLVAAVAWAVSPLAIANALDGLETALALAFQLGMLEAWLLAREEKAPTRWYWVTGVLAGLALLARIDSAFLVLAFGVVAMIELKDRAPLFARIIAGAAVVVAPWWVYASLRWGSPIPEGAGAIHAVLVAQGASWPKTLAWLGGALVPIADAPGLRSFLLEHDGVGALVAVAAVGAIALLVRRRERIIVALAAHGAGLALLYVVWLPALWYFRRYLEPVYALVILAGALAVARALGPEPAPVWKRLAAALAVVPALGFGLGAVGRDLRSYGLGEDRGWSGGRGMAEPAREVMRILPEGAVVGAFDSGALTYFARPDVRVVNLSGAVDSDALEALEARAVLDYAAARGVTHIAESRAHMESLRVLSSKSAHGIEAAPIGQAKPYGGGDVTTVYAVRLPVARGAESAKPAAP